MLQQPPSSPGKPRPPAALWLKRWFSANRGFVLFLVGFAFFRTAIADWNPIPTGSMRPTILEGDVVFVNRTAYDFKLPLSDHALARIADPQRGDIVTFHSPRDGTRLIKRLVAVPGDVVEMRGEVLVINGVAAAYSGINVVSEPVAPGVSLPAARATEHLAGAHRTVQYLAGTGRHKSFGPITVPAGHYFMLGDNRDNSEDSRYIGTVARELLIGRAVRIVVSADITGHWLPRLERTAARLQ